MGEVSTAARRGKVASMTMHSWEGTLESSQGNQGGQAKPTRVPTFLLGRDVKDARRNGKTWSYYSG